MKKLISLIMSVVMIFSLSNIALANNNTFNNSSKKSDVLKLENFSWNEYKEGLEKNPSVNVTTPKRTTLNKNTNSDTISLNVSNINTEITHTETSNEDILFFNETDTNKSDTISINKKTGIIKLDGEKVTITKESVQENTKNISSTYSASSDSWEYMGSNNYTINLSRKIRDVTNTALATLMVAALELTGLLGVFVGFAASILVATPALFLDKDHIYLRDYCWLEADAIYPRLKQTVYAYYDPARTLCGGSTTNIIYS
ncbi:MAG: hypothetical protein AB7E42_05665 [Anaerotignaceae bacterium]